MIDTKAIDILNSFSEACREEFDSVRVDENCRVVITRFVEEGPSSGRNLSGRRGPAAQSRKSRCGNPEQSCVH